MNAAVLWNMLRVTFFPTPLLDSLIGGSRSLPTGELSAWSLNRATIPKPMNWRSDRSSSTPVLWVCMPLKCARMHVCVRGVACERMLAKLDKEKWTEARSYYNATRSFSCVQRKRTELPMSLRLPLCFPLDCPLPFFLPFWFAIAAQWPGWPMGPMV